MSLQSIYAENEGVALLVSCALLLYLSCFLILMRYVDFKSWRQYSKSQRDISKIRVVELTMAALHSVITCSAAVSILVNDHLRQNDASSANFHMELYCCLHIGYFVSDMIFAIYTKTSHLHKGFSVMCHHVVAALGFYIVARYKVFGFYACFRGLSELSTPFLSIRGILCAINITNGKMYYTNGIVFVIIFIAVRIFPIPYLYWKITCSMEWFRRLPSVLFGVFLFINASLDCLNVYWLFRILSTVFTLITQRNKHE